MPNIRWCRLSWDLHKSHGSSSSKSQNTHRSRPDTLACKLSIWCGRGYKWNLHEETVLLVYLCRTRLFAYDMDRMNDSSGVYVRVVLPSLCRLIASGQTTLWFP